MILSFSVFREKLESGEKKQTIRKYSAGQYQRFLNCWKKRETTGRYNLFWHNPRNGGTRIKDVVPSDHPFLFRFDPVQGVVNIGYEEGHNAFVYFPEECEELAHLDGFDSYADMISWFLKEYGKELYSFKFIVIRWS